MRMNVDFIISHLKDFSHKEINNVLRGNKSHSRAMSKQFFTADHISFASEIPRSLSYGTD